MRDARQDAIAHLIHDGSPGDAQLWSAVFSQQPEVAGLHAGTHWQLPALNFDHVVSDEVNHGMTIAPKLFRIKRLHVK